MYKLKRHTVMFFLFLKFPVLANDFQIFEQAKQDRLTFWDEQASCLDWFSKWNQTLTWDPPYAKWYLGGKINACYNCLDRHVINGNQNKIAIYWEGEKGEERVLTYGDLFSEVNKFSNVLKTLNVKKGDKVAIYMPMIPEAVIAMLGCARMGAVHTVIFGGFSAEALKGRIQDAGAKLLITADAGFRKGKHIQLKEAADSALLECPTITSTLVVQHSGQKVTMKKGRDFWFHELMKEAAPSCAPEWMDAEDELFILYTSGTTGKPKGIIHTTGGYMVGVTQTMRWVFDVRPSDVYFCTADIGWITGHSYLVYGPLSNGITQILYEGAPDYPKEDRFWKLIEKYKATIFYTSPTAIRTFMKWGNAWPENCNLTSLRILGSVGEPINPEAWNWYHTIIGRGSCPIADTWWQTETGSIMIAPYKGKIELKPGSATQPLPGIDAAIINDSGELASTGYLVLTSPWPSMMRGIHNDPKRYEDTYWKKWNNKFYFTGDGAKIDQDGYYWLQGRVDDVINVSGHRLSTSEIEAALTECKGVVEAAAIAISHEIKGQAVVGFVTLKNGTSPSKDLENLIKSQVVKKIGAIARPERIIFIYELPKTRSGKIMRRLLRDIAEGKVMGDVSTLSNGEVLREIKHKYEKEESV